MQLAKLVRIVVAWSVFMLIIACGALDSEEILIDEPEVNEPAVPAAPVAPEATAAPVAPEATAAPAAAGGGACSRIAGCCRAYIDAMGGSLPTSTCDAYSNIQGMQDSLCEQTMAGYRAGLQAMSKTVPTECN